VAEIERKVGKQGKRNAFLRFILSKGDKDKIAGWNRDFLRVLHVFNVRSIHSVEHSCVYNLLSDRADNRYQHDGCGDLSKHVGRAGGCTRPKSFGRCDLAFTDNRILTTS
jgi:hypothetical protein